MANMSYCRFENTLADLQDCSEHIGDNPASMSEREAEARSQLIQLCADIAIDSGKVEWPD